MTLENLVVVDSGHNHATLFADDLIFSLKEYEKPFPNKGLRRIQELKVVKNDKVVTFTKDLGLVYDTATGERRFKDEDGFVIPGGIVKPNGRVEIFHTVDELVGLAERLRDEPPTEFAVEHDATAGEYLDELLEQDVNELGHQQTKRSVFGPKYTHMRN